ncbi:MAG TPA: hemolysin family protein [Eubacteriales bacterium]|nr:hemolysin family protein [Eubacteriales bacterium]
MDDGSPIGFIVLIVFLIFASGYFSSAETAMATVNRIRIMSLSENGDKRAKRVLYILDHFDQALTTILIGNNITHIACASAATLFASKLWGVSAVTAATFVTTLVVFLFAEMIPKRFAKAVSEPYALAISGSLIFFMKVLSPVAKAFSAFGGLVGKPFRKKVEEPTVTEDELYDIIETVATEGVIDEEKTELVQSALEFSDTSANDILTPWDRVVKIRMTMTEDEILCAIKENVHSRLPVVDVHDRPIGMLQIRKYLKAYLKGGPSVPLAKVMDEPRFVSANTAIDDLLPLMSTQRTQIAIVTDDDNKVLGVVTVEDILEELVGEIYDEDDRVDTAGGSAK